MAAQEVSYVIITPYTIAKSRTGGVISRLLSRVDLELVGGQIFAPSQDLARSYADSIRARPSVTEAQTTAKELLADHILRTFTPSDGRRHRVMMLLFRGEDACRKLKQVVGTIRPKPGPVDAMTGETIRDTYADLVWSRYNPKEVVYFEPAVLTPPDQQSALTNMRTIAEFLRTQPNIVENMSYDHPNTIERTMVIIKPDNWRYPSSRPGTIIDMFSRTGLRIIGCKIVRMSVADAVEFYGPVERALELKLAPSAGRRARTYLEERFGFRLGDDMERTLAETFGHQYAREQFARIIEFMSGYRPPECPPEQRNRPGKVKSMVLIYEGPGAVERIRAVLGPTDPMQAPGGTVRKEFGSDVMVNTAHASDSQESAHREMDILDIQTNDLHMIIEDFLHNRQRD